MEKSVMPSIFTGFFFILRADKIIPAADNGIRSSASQKGICYPLSTGYAVVCVVIDFIQAVDFSVIAYSPCEF